MLQCKFGQKRSKSKMSVKTPQKSKKNVQYYSINLERMLNLLKKYQNYTNSIMMFCLKKRFSWIFLKIIHDIMVIFERNFKFDFFGAKLRFFSQIYTIPPMSWMILRKREEQTSILQCKFQRKMLNLLKKAQYLNLLSKILLTGLF